MNEIKWIEIRTNLGNSGADTYVAEVMGGVLLKERFGSHRAIVFIPNAKLTDFARK